MLRRFDSLVKLGYGTNRCGYLPMRWLKCRLFSTGWLLPFSMSFLSTNGSSAAAERTWIYVTQKGHQELESAGVEGDQVVLRKRDEETITLPLATLSCSRPTVRRQEPDEPRRGGRGGKAHEQER